MSAIGSIDTMLYLLEQQHLPPSANALRRLRGDVERDVTAMRDACAELADSFAARHWPKTRTTNQEICRVGDAINIAAAIRELPAASPKQPAREISEPSEGQDTAAPEKSPVEPPGEPPHAQRALVGKQWLWACGNERTVIAYGHSPREARQAWRDAMRGQSC